jgi:DUF4097 and DUF4098 domain-containing protein YvlB
MSLRTTFIVLLTLACGALCAAQTKNVDKTLALRASGSVTLESHNGSIHVETWDRPEIEIHARIESASSSTEDLRRFHETTVQIDGSGDFVRIKSVLPDCCNLFTGNNPEIHYTIQAPRTARWTIRDHNSRTEIRDLHAALDLDTHNGSVRVVNLAGPLALKMHNGRADVEFASFTASSSVDTHNATVELTLPANSKFDLHTDGHNSSVNSDFAVLARMSGRRWQSLEGPVNGGGPSLRLSSHNGNFRLRSR